METQKEPKEPGSADQGVQRRRPLPVLARPTSPLTWAFAGSIGVLLGLAIGGVVAALGGVIASVVIALFLALALDPLVRRIERRGFARGRSIAMVFGRRGGRAFDPCRRGAGCGRPGGRLRQRRARLPSRSSAAIVVPDVHRWSWR